MRFIKFFIVITVVIAVLLSTGCVEIYAPKQAAPQTSQDPLVGEWQMTRIGINPTIPFPDLIVNQVISDKATWKITRQPNGQLKITYDGNETWFKTPGMSADKKPTTVNEDASHTSCTFISGGSMYIDKLPSIPGITQRMEQISITYNDAVKVSLTSAGRLSATITEDVSGKYYGEMEIGGMRWKTIDQLRYTITYDGTRK